MLPMQILKFLSQDLVYKHVSSHLYYNSMITPPTHSPFIYYSKKHGVNLVIWSFYYKNSLSISLANSLSSDRLAVIPLKQLTNIKKTCKKPINQSSSYRLFYISLILKLRGVFTTLL